MTDEPTERDIAELQAALNKLAEQNQGRIVALPSGSKLIVHEQHIPAREYVDRDDVVRLDEAYERLLDAARVMLDASREDSARGAEMYQAAHALVKRMRAELELDRPEENDDQD